MGEKEWIVDVADELVSELKLALLIYDRPTRRSEFIEFLVDKFHGMKIEIFAREHPPPHFRLTVQGKHANYTISDCTLLAGTVPVNVRVLREWHTKNKQALIDKWNSTRPENCPVGKYIE